MSPAAPYRAVVFLDLDGTLLDEHHQGTPEARELLRRLEEREVLPAVATGRCTWEVAELLGDPAAASGVMSGGCCTWLHGALVQEQRLDRALVAEIADFSRTRGEALSFFAADCYAATTIAEPVASSMTSLGVPLADVPVDPDFWRDHVVQFVNAYIPEAADAAYRARFGDRAHFTRYSAGAVDILPRGVSKGHAAQALLAADPRLAGVPTFAFGDERNDLDIFARVGTGIAMPGSHPELLARAGETAPLPGPAGIAAALQRHGLL
jgi:HAD superfamily hydrolase (TIGR01484 family)